LVKLKLSQVSPFELHYDRKALDTLQFIREKLPPTLDLSKIQIDSFSATGLVTNINLSENCLNTLQEAGLRLPENYTWISLWLAAPSVYKQNNPGVAAYIDRIRYLVLHGHVDLFQTPWKSWNHNFFTMLLTTSSLTTTELATVFDEFVQPAVAHGKRLLPSVQSLLSISEDNLIWLLRCGAKYNFEIDQRDEQGRHILCYSRSQRVAEVFAEFRPAAVREPIYLKVRF